MKFQTRKTSLAAIGLGLAAMVSVPAMGAGLIPNNNVHTTGDPAGVLVQAPQLNITIGGASATDKTLGSLIQQLCKAPLDLTKFQSAASGATSAGANFQAYYCTIDHTKVTGLTSDMRVLIRKRSKDGSGTGALPVCAASQVGEDPALASARFFMKVDANCTYGSNNGTFSTYNCSDGGASDTESIPQTNAGITDTAPSELFYLATNKTTKCNTVKSIYGTDFSIVATKALRDALQCAQGKTVGSETAANMPTLSKGVISSIESGSLTDWSQVMIGGKPLTESTRLAACTPSLSPPANTYTTYLRREPTSGTFASNELRVNGVDNGNGECAIGNFGSLTFPGNIGVGPIVPYLYAGSGDIDGAMDLLSQGTYSVPQLNGGVCDGSAAATVPFWYSGTCDDFNFFVTLVNAQMSTWAIAHQSTERNGNNGNDNSFNYRTIAIDGVVPTLDNIAAGKYDFWVESHGEYQTSNVDANQKAIVDQIFKNTQSASQIATANSLNTGSVHGWGQGGVFAIKNNGNCDSSTFNATTNPCSAFSRSRGGSSTPNCSAASVVPAGSTTGSQKP